ncbi:hypothetical protein GPECTOR_10g940 [Gonium pectorale]|uniref:Uncharacterized protein n=1 Tax=Gonium pectorale TaxID=33097 RepID=A0A150GRE6_GONPE|nr:hypothetical protein GPECTOR_10g940 [Gonium pectorale]|eukprot:KXZ52308.1 hypothetical protein GPECTOR_10g940 [Gonium pectorale]
MPCRSLAVLLPLGDAPLELSSLHLAGAPLTPPLGKALQPLLTAAAAAPAGKAAASALDALSTSSSSPPPLQLCMYGYDLTHGTAAAVLEQSAAAAAARLHRLELWGCVGWPPRLGATLAACGQLQQLCVSFQSLAGTGPSASAGSGTAAAAAASGGGSALASYSHLAAALTAVHAVKSLGALKQLRSLELRGVAFRGTVPASVARARAVRRHNPKPDASPEDAAEAAGLTPQLLACALFQLTALTSLTVEGLRSTAPLTTALAVMRNLRRLELPDALGPPAELAALARAAPRLTELTLGSVGHGPVMILTDTEERAAAAARRPPEPLPLPPALTALRVAHCRPTLRALRAVRRALEARAAGVGPSAVDGSGSAGAGAGADAGGGGASAVPLALTVPGIELDLPDVDFDPLQV